MILYKVYHNEIHAYFDYTKKVYASPMMYYKWIDDINTAVRKKFKTDVINYIPIIKDELCKEKNLYGISKCSQEDVFNEDIGKLIAGTKLIEKYNNVYNRVVFRIVNEINNIPHVKRLKTTLIKKQNIITSIYSELSKEIVVGKIFCKDDVDLYKMR